MKEMTNRCVRDQIRVISLHDSSRQAKFLEKLIPETG